MYEIQKINRSNIDKGIDLDEVCAIVTDKRVIVMATDCRKYICFVDDEIEIHDYDGYDTVQELLENRYDYDTLEKVITDPDDFKITIDVSDGKKKK